MDWSLARQIKRETRCVREHLRPPLNRWQVVMPRPVAQRAWHFAVQGSPDCRALRARRHRPVEKFVSLVHQPQGVGALCLSTGTHR